MSKGSRNYAWITIRIPNTLGAMMLKKLILGSAAAVFFMAFSLWILRPVDGYFRPVLGHEGTASGLFYVETSWWGLKRTEYPVTTDYDHAYYEKDGRNILIEDWKYYPREE